MAGCDVVLVAANGLIAATAEQGVVADPGGSNGNVAVVVVVCEEAAAPLLPVPIPQLDADVQQ